MGLNKFGLAVAVVGLGATTAVVVTISQIRKHGGHITIGVGSREFGWEFDGKKKLSVIGED